MAKRQRRPGNGVGARRTDLEDDRATLCDICGIERPSSETDTHEACGAQVCNECMLAHEAECIGE